MKSHSLTRSLICLLAIVTLVFAFAIPTTLLGASIPNGAKKLTKKNIFQAKDKSGKFFCGKIGKKFIPGKKVSGYFYSHQAELKNLQAKLKKTKNKKKKNNLKKQITKINNLITNRKDVCLKKVTPTPTPTPTPEPVAFRFDFSDAVGVALSEAQSSKVYDSEKLITSSRVVSITDTELTSNLKKVDAAGNLIEAISSGKASIKKFFVAENKIYLYFEKKINVSNTNDDCNEQSINCCLLAEVNRVTGEVYCVDSSVSTIDWIDDGYGFMQPIQFDDAGAIYYLGRDESKNSILKKYLGGVSTDFYFFENYNTEINNFLALPNGSVVVYGRTISTNTLWLMTIPANGQGLNPIFANFKIFDLVRLSDDNLYISALKLTTSDWIMYRKRYDEDEKNPIIGWFNGNAGDQCDGVFYDLTNYLTCKDGIYEFDPVDPFCPSSGGNIITAPTFYVSPSGNAFKYEDQVLFQWYPIVKGISSAVKIVAVKKGFNNNLILGGVDIDGNFLTTLYNVDNDVEDVILEPNTYEPYHFNYLPNSNEIIFDGLRFSDGKYVVGKINLTTRKVTSVPTGTNGKLVDFSTFK